MQIWQALQACGAHGNSPHRPCQQALSARTHPRGAAKEAVGVLAQHLYGLVRRQLLHLQGCGNVLLCGGAGAGAGKGNTSAAAWRGEVTCRVKASSSETAERGARVLLTQTSRAVQLECFPI